MARMLSRMHPSFCPACRRGPAGLDCPDDGVDKRTQRAREKRQWRREWKEGPCPTAAPSAGTRSPASSTEGDEP